MAVLLAITQNRTPKRPEKHIPTASIQGNSLWSLLNRCWAAEPGSRPTAGEVRDNVSIYEHRLWASAYRPQMAMIRTEGLAGGEVQGAE
jgi:hypothetical protein